MQYLAMEAFCVSEVWTDEFKCAAPLTKYQEVKQDFVSL